MWLLVLSALCLCGCDGHARRAASPAPVFGTANLNVLVKSHPGWRGVEQFDGALRRLQSAQGTAAAGANPALASLPAENASAPPLPPAVREGQRQRLLILQARQVVRLRDRRSRARQAQITALRAGWMQQAEGRYAQDTAMAQARYVRRVRAALEQDSVRRLNLVLQVRALENTVGAWKLSTPPTPELNQAKALLAKKQSELASLDMAQGGMLAEAKAERESSLAQARLVRDAFVNAQTQETEARLLAQDETQAAALAQRLTRQLQELLAAQEQFTVPTVSAAGGLAAESLPNGPVPQALTAQQAARSEASLSAARNRLAAQRTRWVKFLYDDTRAAALDAARQHGWRLTFSGPRAGLTDLTPQVARTLSQDVWKG